MGIRWVVGALLAGTAVAATGPVASASADTFVLGFRGSTATTVLRTVDGCIATDIDVTALELLGMGPGERSGQQGPAAIVHVTRRDQCTGEMLVFGGGVDFDVDVEIGPRLTSAHVHGVVPVLDIESGQTLPVAVDVEWTGTGELVRDTEYSHYVDDGLIVKTHDNGTFRPGTALGHVRTGTLELAPEGTTANALMYWANYGQVIISGQTT
jgi:hypothetical protein